MVVGMLRPVAILTAALTITAMIPTAASAHPPGTTERVSVSTAGTAGDNDSLLASISADGRYVAFWSLASNTSPATPTAPATCSSTTAPLAPPSGSA